MTVNKQDQWTDGDWPKAPEIKELEKRIKVDFSDERCSICGAALLTNGVCSNVGCPKPTKHCNDCETPHEILNPTNIGCL